MEIPFLKPDIREDDIRRAVKSIKSGWLVYGPYAKEAEAALARTLRALHVALTASCTAALHMGLVLAGIKAGDEVITTPYSWVSTSDVILYQGAKPVFADVDPETGILDIREVEKKITKKTKAILLVHLFGQMADMKAFRALAAKHRLAIVEDSAHALGASRDGVRPGQYGFCAAFSFHAAKNLTSGQGGALALKSAALDTRARAIRRNGVLGRNEHRQKRELGAKYDGTDFQAALLVGQIARIPEMQKARQKIWKRYEDGLRGMKGLTFQKRQPRSVHAAHMFVVWVAPNKRDKIRKALEKKGIQTSIHWDPIHLEPFYQKLLHHKRGSFPIAERLGLGAISLPTYPGLTVREQDHIIRALRSLA
jgi:dTDP-4-amino-4,6-dideoxygalactose transaminase